MFRLGKNKGVVTETIVNRLKRRHGRAENNHGLYTDITKEKEFMDITTSEKYVVGHFYHKDFRRCKIMDTHLEVKKTKQMRYY